MRLRTSSRKYFSFPPIARDILVVQSCNISHSNDKKNLNKVISILMHKSELPESYIFSESSNLEWPHRQGGCLVCFRLQGRLPAHAACTDLYCARRAQGVLPMRVGVNGQSIRSTISEVIVRSWLWSIATRSCPLATSVALLQVVDI